MSATVTKNRSNHIRYLKKEIGNGDIDSEINKELKLKNKKTVRNQLQKMKEPMKKFENGLQKKAQKRPQSTRNNYDYQLKKDLRKVNENQKKLNQKLRNIPYNNKNNPNNFFSKQKRLPNTIREIEDNIELSRLLLKNPDKMTTEEKVYIASFNDREFKLFIEYLKMKDRELKWQGNGLGSGHYYEGFISIYRKCGSNANERFSRLQNFLKINYDNKKAKDYNDERKKIKKGGNLFEEENGLKGDNMGKVEAEYNFEKNTKDLMDQLEKYKNILDQQKREFEMKKFDSEVNAINRVLDSQRNQLQNDINNLNQLKNNNYDLDELYQKYVIDYELSKDGKEVNEKTLGKKISKYLKDTGLTPDELAHRFVEEGLSINENTIDHNYINISHAEQKFKELKILDEEEAKHLCEIIMNFSDKYIREDLFVVFIKGLVEDAEKSAKRNKTKLSIKKKVQFIPEEEKTTIGDNLVNEEESENEDIESYDDDNQNDIKGPKKKLDYGERVRNKIKGKYFKEFEDILSKKGATTINKIAKGFLIRKKIKIKRIYTMIMAKRITNLLRKNYREKMKFKNEAAKKITYLIKKNYWSKRDLKAMAQFSSRWIRNNKRLTNTDKKNIAATFIQITWRKHRALIEQNIREFKNKMTKDMLKSKICFICKNNKVFCLCKDCENNHYCEECFRMYHSRGNKRNHNYITINELQDKDYGENKRITPEFIDQREMIKKYLNEHHLNLYQCLSMWDFKKNNTITYLNLQDALKVGGFGIDKNIQKAILDYSLKYVTNGNRVLNHNKYIISLKFCTDFL